MLLDWMLPRFESIASVLAGYGMKRRTAGIFDLRAENRQGVEAEG